MFSLLINEDRIIWLSLIGSLLIHALIFIFSGTTFIQRAQYSVQPAAQMVEVSIEETKEHRDTLSQGEASVKVSERINKVNGATHSRAGVRVKANPDYFQNPSPEYPELARQMRQEGLVILSVDVNSKGDPLKVEIMRSSGFRLLDQAALKAVSRWKFQPGSVENIPVESTVTVPIRFRLEK